MILQLLIKKSCFRAVPIGAFNQTFRTYHAIKGVFGNYQPSPSTKSDTSLPKTQSPAHRLILNAFQTRGHQFAQLNLLDPIGTTSPHELSTEKLRTMSSVLGVNLEQFVNNVPGDGKAFLEQLTQVYCGGIGYEFGYLSSQEEIRWFEDALVNKDLASIDQDLVAKSLLEAEAFDHFLAKKFQSVKRYGGEGAETMITFVDEIIRLSREPEVDLSEVIIGMPHRGRLNLLVNTLQVPPEVLFRKMTGKPEFTAPTGSFIGDVLSHLFTSADYSTESRKFHATLLPNPSHLEVAAPMICGYARGKLLHFRSGPYDHDGTEGSGSGFGRLPIQIHGDASFSGQGIIMETLAMANVEHYSIGGSIHLVVNNQVGYTMPGRYGQARSSTHCSDQMKMIHAPVIHVNGSRPELVAQAARLAFGYRQKFHKDICVNLVCFRRWGHNELDDPTFTNPSMYKQIHAQKSIPTQFVERIQLPENRKSEIVQTYNEKLNKALASVESFQPEQLSTLNDKNSVWKKIQWPSKDVVTKWGTWVPEDTLKRVGELSVQVKDGFNLHSTLKRVFADRLAKINGNQGMDWATAESLAFGSLMADGISVRISGQDVGRGTFSQRHAMLVDQETDDILIPLNAVNSSPLPKPEISGGLFGKLEVCNSILSEEGVMAFEYGLSIATPTVLPIWEAQFGDFFNGAQSIIDTLIASGESKWLLQSALTLLLPHGYDGAGPEHTSSKLERFLQLSDSSETEIDSDQVNWSVAYPTTPAQYFHLLRRQMTRPYRKPLVVMSPKMLLRHPRCVSTLSELSTPGSHFSPILDDTTVVDAKAVKSIVFCSGKHYYTLEKEREDRKLTNSGIVLVRLEELCPFPVEGLVQIFKRYPNAKNLIWSQEEHRNMGAWSFVAPRFANLLKQKLTYAGRGHLCAPAVGIGAIHQAEVKQIVEDTFKLCQ